MTDEPDNSTRFAALAWARQEVENPFQRYAGISEDDWEAKILRSLTTSEIDGIAFPRFPPVAMQERVHGHSGEHAMRETFDFYRLIRRVASTYGLAFDGDKRLLDFGTGWGRAMRPFMRDLSLDNIYGYEPLSWFAQASRSLNPYVATIGGPATPPLPFATSSFDLVISWSVFSHLPEHLLRAWLEEFTRILRPGGLIVFTAWGVRFFDTLAQDKQRADAGETIHWYHKVVIEAIGDMAAARQRYNAGQHVFIASSPNPDYGEAFISPTVARNAARGLELLATDETTLPQDVYVFRRR